MNIRNSNYRYLINTDDDNKEVHDLQNEKSQCQIDEIKNFKFITSPYYSDLISWLKNNSDYDGCQHCLPGLHRK